MKANFFFRPAQLTILSLSIFFASCSQDDISDKMNVGKGYDERNVIVRYNGYMLNQVVNKDSLYVNIHGEGFTIEELSFLVTNFRYISNNLEDTIWMGGENHATFNMVDKTTKIGKLPRGNYNGYMYFDIGVNDSMHNVYLDSIFNNIPEFLRNQEWFKPNVGFLSTRIRGLVHDTLFPTDSIAAKPYEISLGGPEHFIEMRAEANFTINNNTEIILILDWNIDEVFNIYSLMTDTIIESDISFIHRFEIAEEIRDTLQNSFYLR